MIHDNHSQVLSVQSVDNVFVALFNVFMALFMALTALFNMFTTLFLPFLQQTGGKLSESLVRNAFTTKFICVGGPMMPE